MGVPRAVRQQYARDEDSLFRVFRYVEQALGPWCEDEGYAFSGRVKELESVAEKLGTGRFRRWSELDDLVAYTVVVPTVSHEENVLTKLRATFREQRKQDRGTTQKAPEVFRFDSMRWYGKVRGEPTPPELVDQDLNRPFEVQVKTAFEHAWSTVTHDLVYKGQRVDWKSKRLAAQLKAQVEQIDVLINTFQTAAASIPESKDFQTDAEAALIRRFQSLETDGCLDESVVPASWQRFGESVFVLARRRSRNSEEAAKIVADLVSEFDAAVRAGTFQIAVSGSLVQAVVAFAIQTWGADQLARVPVVWDADLHSFYGSEEPPTLVDLEA